MMLADLAHDGLPMPREHFLATHCEECTHLRSEHIDDGICMPRHGTCDCVRMTRINLMFFINL